MTAADDNQFEVRNSFVGDAVVITVLGEVDIISASELSRAIDVVPDQTSRLVIDLCDVTFLDSSGLNALLRAKQALEEKSIVFHVVVRADSVVRRVFEITQLTASLSVVDTLEQVLS